MFSGTMWLKMAGPAPKLGCSLQQSCKAIARPASFEEPSSPDRDLQLTRSCHLLRVSSGYGQHSDLAHHRSPLRVPYLRFAGRFFRACMPAIDPILVAENGDQHFALQFVFERIPVNIKEVRIGRRFPIVLNCASRLIKKGANSAFIISSTAFQ
jgi:hypothetical protein